MDPNVIALLISFAFVFVVLGLASVIAKFTKGASENSRKFVHIVVGHWVFILLMFNNIWAAMLVPFTFIIVNALSTRYKIFKAMERNDESLGTVYYAVSLTVLTGLGFYLDWLALPFIGVLVMAYGDGFAAIIGKKFGKRKPFSFAPDKSIAGSLTVFFFATVITGLTLYFFNGQGAMITQTLPMILVIAGLTGTFASFIELTGHKGCDNLTLPIGSAIFSVLLFQFGDLYLYIYLVVAMLVLLVAYKLKSITVDGMVTALLVAVTLYALSGYLVGIALIAFFILGSLASKIKNKTKVLAESVQEKRGPRTWKQVIANSFPAILLSWLYLIFPQANYLLLLAFSVFSAATADTISSEIGMLSKENAFHILTFRKHPRGLSGGVTFTGLLAGVVGSFLISLLVFIQYGLVEYILVASLGVFGTLIDSILGALLQRKYQTEQGILVESVEGSSSTPVKGFKLISNNVINFITLNVVVLGGYLYLIIYVLS